MTEQHIKTNILYMGVPGVAHVVQGDSGRYIIAEISDYTPPESATASATYKTPSAAIYGPINAQISGNIVRFRVRPEWTTEAGEGTLTITLLDAGDLVSTFAIKMIVEPAAAYSGHPGESAGKIYVYVDGSAVEIAKQADLTEAVTNAAATQKEVDDTKIKLTATREEMQGLTNSQIITGWSDPELRNYIALNGTVADISAPKSSGSRWNWVCIEAEEGEAFILSGDRGDEPRPYAFCDKDYKILKRAVAGEIADNLYITAPFNTKYLILNRKIGTKDSYRLGPVRVGKVKARYTYNEWQHHDIITLAEVKKDVESTATSFTGAIKPANVQGYGDRLAAAHSDEVTIYNYAAAPGCDTAIKLRAYEIKNAIDRYTSSQEYAKAEKQSVVLITAGVHGNEVEMVYAAHKLIDELLNTDSLAWLKDNYKVVVAPLVTPYGAQTTQRDNVNGVNINRNFEPFWDAYKGADKGSAPLSETETKFVNQLFTKYKPDIYFDFHNCSGANDYGHSLTFNPEFFGVAQDAFSGSIRSMKKYTYAPDGQEITWDYRGQTDTIPVVGSKDEPETYAQAASKGIKAILTEAPIRAAAISGNNGGRVLHSPEVVTFSYERMINTIKAVLKQYESEV